MRSSRAAIFSAEPVRATSGSRSARPCRSPDGESGCSVCDAGCSGTRARYGSRAADGTARAAISPEPALHCNGIGPDALPSGDGAGARDGSRSASRGHVGCAGARTSRRAMPTPLVRAPSGCRGSGRDAAMGEGGVVPVGGGTRVSMASSGAGPAIAGRGGVAIAVSPSNSGTACGGIGRNNIRRGASVVRPGSALPRAAISRRYDGAAIRRSCFAGRARRSSLAGYSASPGSRALTSNSAAPGCRCRRKRMPPGCAIPASRIAAGRNRL